MENTLFNQHRMEKYAKDKSFNLNLSHHDLIKEHTEKLEKGELKAETSNYLYFFDVFLRDILGYNRKENILFDETVDKGAKRSEFVLKNGDEKFMIVELKGQNVDLDKPQKGHNNQTPVDQAREYSLKTKSANWIMVSNYDEFRLYHWEKKDDYISFKAEELLDKEKFRYFMLAFSKKSHLKENYTDKLLKKSLVVEKDIEADFYKLFHETRLMLIKELEDINGFETPKAVHYAQAILNRYMFICFAEDINNLLPSEISTETIYVPIKERNISERTIWNRLNELFGFINKGNEYKGINGYNGGLFKEDFSFITLRDIVEDPKYFKEQRQKWDLKEYSLKITELMGPYGTKINPIYWNLLTISSINFESDLDVNILGHIFENSIGDLEDLREGTKGRRKKEGIFYTPNYITEYICKNTIIPYLSKSGESTEVKDLIREYWGSEIHQLDEKVKKIKIIDPACGSGAFLNKAADILLEIHEEIHKEIYKDDKTLAQFFDNVSERRKILKNNIYGVDLNEESVEITKLAMFLKVAQKDAKLPDIDKNIKCGNSIIDDPEYAGEKAFNWGREFPEIFEEGGFDVIIGNPPYIRIQTLNHDKNMVKFFKKTYKSAVGNYDIYNLFVEKSFELVKEKHEIGFILPNKFILADYGIGLRKIINEFSALRSILNFKDNQIFEGASTYTCLLFLKTNTKKFKYVEINQFNPTIAFNIIKNNKIYDDNNIAIGEFNSEEYLKEDWKFYVGKSASLINCLTQIPLKLEDIAEKIFQGLATSADKIYIVESVREIKDLMEVYSQETNKYHLIEKKLLKKVIKGKETKKYGFDYKDRYLIFPYILNESDFRLIDPKTFEEEYPHTWKYFKLNEDKIRARERGKMDHDKWYAFTYPKSMLDYRNKKIMTPNSAFNASFAYDTRGEYYTTTGVSGGFAIKLKDNTGFNEWYLLSILNSSLMNFLNKKIGKSLQGGFYSFEGRVIKNYPLIQLKKEKQDKFIQKSLKYSNLVSQIIEETKNFKEWLINKYEIKKLSKKLEKYYELNFEEFLEEVKKKKDKKIDIEARKSRELIKNEFNESLAVINPLLHEIKVTNREIDEMVYDLYGLTPEERQIVEGSLSQ